MSSLRCSLSVTSAMTTSTGHPWHSQLAVYNSASLSRCAAPSHSSFMCLLACLFGQALLSAPSLSPSLQHQHKHQQQQQQLSSARLLLTLLSDARLSRSQCPGAACVAAMLVCLARFAEQLTLACTNAAVSGAGGAQDRMDQCWGAVLMLCCCLAQQQQVSSMRHSLTHTHRTSLHNITASRELLLACAELTDGSTGLLIVHRSVRSPACFCLLCVCSCVCCALLQRYSLSVQDCLSMMQIAMSASASFTATAANTATVLSSVPAHVCALLVCLMENRAQMILPDSSSLLVALIRAVLQSLNAPALPSVAVQRTALALTRLLSRLPGLDSDSGGRTPLSAALPAVLHDYLTACKQCVDVERGLVWQSAVQPAVAALLLVMSEHDVTATHLMLPSSERELFKPIIAHYKREIRYRGQ